MSMRGAVFGAVLLAASGIAAAETPKDRALDKRVQERHAQGVAVYDTESDEVKAAAGYAVSAQSAATGADLKLLSIKDARRAVLANPPPLSLSLIVLKDAKPESVRAEVRRHLDGTYQLVRWSWHSETDSRAEQLLRWSRERKARSRASLVTQPDEKQSVSHPNATQ